MISYKPTKDDDNLKICSIVLYNTKKYIWYKRITQNKITTWLSSRKSTIQGYRTLQNTIQIETQKRLINYNLKHQSVDPNNQYI